MSTVLSVGQSDFKDVDNNRWYSTYTEATKDVLKLQIWLRVCPASRIGY